MTRRLVLVLALTCLLAAPTIPAQPAADVTVHRHTVTITETPDGIDAEEELDVEVLNGTFDGNLTLRVPRLADGFAGTLTRQDTGESADIPDGSLARQEPERATDEPFLMVNVWEVGYDGTPQAARFTLVVSYEIPGVDTYSKTTVRPAEQLLVFATPAPDSDVYAIGLGADLQPTLDGRFHAMIADAPAGRGVNIVFQPTAATAQVEDMTRYVWAVAGLLAGVFVMYVVIKQGWLTIRRPKRFEKGGDMESAKMLEARRRTLMAALKELETAHDSKQIPDDAYAPLKEEYKAQAVRVLRALESKKEPGQKR